MTPDSRRPSRNLRIPDRRCQSKLRCRSSASRCMRARSSATSRRRGKPVKAGEPIYEVETEKVLYEVEAPGSGVLALWMHPEGDTVECGGLVALIATPGEDVAALAAQHGAGSAGARPRPAAAEGGAPSGAPPSAAQAAPPAAPDGRRLVSPVARKLATELGVELARVNRHRPRWSRHARGRRARRPRRRGHARPGGAREQDRAAKATGTAAGAAVPAAFSEAPRPQPADARDAQDDRRADAAEPARNRPAHDQHRSRRQRRGGAARTSYAASSISLTRTCLSMRPRERSYAIRG